MAEKQAHRQLYKDTTVPTKTARTTITMTDTTEAMITIREEADLVAAMAHEEVEAQRAINLREAVLEHGPVGATQDSRKAVDHPAAMTMTTMIPRIGVLNQAVASSEVSVMAWMIDSG